MAAFLASVLSFLLPRVHAHLARYSGTCSPRVIPLPSQPHLLVSSERIASFDEVLVIGDVHGCYDELIELLTKARDSAPDSTKRMLKVFVGDLVNKGPKSRQVLQFLLQPDSRETCLSVRGNHDDVVVDQILNVIRKDASKLPLKNKWMEEVTDEELHFLMELPYTIHMPSLNALIVHAGVTPGVSVEEMDPRDLVSMRNVVKRSDGSGFTPTKSHKEGSAWATSWLGPQHVYFGHDARRMLQETPHATGLDTGCVYGKELTGVFIKGTRVGQFISVKAKGVHQQV